MKLPLLSATSAQYEAELCRLGARASNAEAAGCRLQDLTAEVQSLPEAHHACVIDKNHKMPHAISSRYGLEGYKAPLIARVHLRLGMWQWTINAEARISDDLLRHTTPHRLHQNLLRPLVLPSSNFQLGRRLL